MAEKTLTAANSVIALTIPGLYVAAVLQGYGVDDVFSSEAVESAETRMGVDGRLSAGFIPTAVPIEFNLQADSPSVQIFEDWDNAAQSAREVVFATGVVRLPSLGRTFALTRGILTRVPRIPSAGKLMRERKFTVTWESVRPASI